MWGIGQRDVPSVLQWFVQLWGFICSETSPKGKLPSLDWLGYLANAAKTVLHRNSSNKTTEHQLLAYGQRRAKNFLGVSNGQWPPFFGLAKDSILAGLAEEDNEERAIAYLRTFVLDDYDSSDAYICGGWKYYKSPNGNMRTCEVMTAVPHICASRKRDANGIQMTEAIHARWLYHESEHCHDPFLNEVLNERLQYFASRGERGVHIRDAPSEIPLKKDWAWENPPFLFNYRNQSLLGDSSCSIIDHYCCPSISSPGVLCRCFDCHDGLSMHSPSWTIGKYSIFVKDNAKLKGRRALENKLNSEAKTICIRQHLPGGYATPQ